jgi:hypothetical protein
MFPKVFVLICVSLTGRKTAYGTKKKEEGSSSRSAYADEHVALLKPFALD